MSCQLQVRLWEVSALLPRLRIDAQAFPEPKPTAQAVAGGAVVTAIMTLYGYYLGHRRHVEDEQAPQLSSGMLRCPFVMGILGKSPNASGSMDGLAGEMTLSKTGSKG